MAVIGIQVLNYGDSSDTLSLVRKLSEDLPKFAECIKLVVIDNFSTLAHRERLISAFMTPELQAIKLLLLDDNRGYGYGNNEGFRYLFSIEKVDAVLALNPDINFPSGNVKCLLNDDLHSKELFSFPVTSQYSKVPSGMYTFSRFGIKVAAITDTYSNGSTPCFPSGCCWGMTREVWNKSGGFSQSLFLYYEEIEFILRFFYANNRYPTVEVFPGENVYHRVGASMPRVGLGRSTTTLFYSSRNRLYITKRYFRAWVPLSLLYNSLILIRAILSLNAKEIYAIVSGTVAGLKGVIK